jgi:hypothetical protein
MTMDEFESVRRIWQDLRLPGVVDVHTHFMPKNVMDKVWQYFDSAGPLTGREWPIRYRTAEEERVHTLRRFGVQAFTSLVYPHKPDMAEWLNSWARDFAKLTPDCIQTATFYPEPGAREYVQAAIVGGARVFKAHIQVGAYDPNSRLLDGVWGTIEDHDLPVIIHCGSGPAPGEFTGPEHIRGLLKRYPRLQLIIAHMGMPEYVDFLDIADEFPQVYLDTTMAFTRFAEEMMPFPPEERHRLRDLGERIVFGSDFPNIPYSYAEAMQALVDLDVDDDWLRNVFYRNGARLFGLN